MPEPIRILLVEDRPTDAELAEREIRKALASCVFQRVETRDEYVSMLEAFQPDLIISDYNMPQFDGLTALNIALTQPAFIPVIIVTSALNEDTAVACMKAGATDYVIKEHRKRLGQAVIHALDEKRLRQERQRAELALRKSEERYRGLYENASIGIIRITPTGRIAMANPAAVRMLGCSSFGELAERNLNEPGFGPTDTPNAFRQRLERDQGISGLETTWTRKDGAVIHVRESGRAIRDENGQVLYYDGTLDDITARKHAEDAQAKLEEQLRQSQKMESIGQLAASIAHDFNNLLTVIDGYCDLIREQVASSDPLYSDIEQIRHASTRAAALTRQLLVFSRKQILAPSILDLNGLVSNVRKLLDRLIGEDISFATMLQPKLQPVIADAGQLEQVIMNLAVNARDAMPTGGKLTIETRNVTIDANEGGANLDGLSGPCVLISVSDTGCGMDEQTQARIFEPFFTTKAPGKGTGLGLATVYGIVKQSGGTIQVESKLNQGTTFKIYLPAGLAFDEPDSAPLTSSNTTYGSETILLVEDDEQMRTLVQTVLHNKGYTIIAARQGLEALALAEQHLGQIDVLMTDVVMPEMNGRELAERLRTMRPDIKSLFISGYTDDTVVRHGLIASEVIFLPKPFSPNMLAMKVREILDSR